MDIAGKRPVIMLPAEGSFGPAMRALPTDGQRRFVMALLELGSNNHTRAAAAAGYEGSTDVLKVTAHRLAHDTKVLAAIHEESQRRLHTGKIMAVSTLLKIAENATKDSDRLKAIEMVLNRTGLHAMSEHVVTTRDDSATDEAMIARIQHLASKLGVDATKLLGSSAGPELKKLDAPIEAEYTVVEPVDASAEGLEDML